MYIFRIATLRSTACFLLVCFFPCFVSLPTGAFDNLFPILYDTPRSIFIFAQNVNYPVLTMNIANGNLPRQHPKYFLVYFCQFLFIAWCGAAVGDAVK